MGFLSLSAVGLTPGLIADTIGYFEKKVQ